MTIRALEIEPPAATEQEVCPPHTAGMKRSLFIGLGILFVGIAIIGVALPGIPTTGPLIAASFFLAKSSPRLEKKLLGLRIFAVYMRYLDGSAPMPKRARLWALVWMWGSILISCYFLSHTAHLRGIKVGGTLAMGCIGTGVITQYRRSAGPVSVPQGPRIPTSTSADKPAQQTLDAVQQTRDSLELQHSPMRSSRRSRIHPKTITCN